MRWFKPPFYNRRERQQIASIYREDREGTALIAQSKRRPTTFRDRKLMSDER